MATARKTTTKAAHADTALPKDVEMLGSQNLASVVIFAEKYFRVFQRIAGAALGE